MAANVIGIYLMSMSPIGVIWQRNTESIAFNVICGLKGNILQTNFMYSIWWDGSYVGTYQWLGDFFP